MTTATQTRWAIPQPDDRSHLATRFRLLEAAAQLMAAHGYAGTSVRAIAAAAGVTAGAIYKHFPDGKEQLLRAILEQVGEHVTRFVAAAVAGHTDPVDAIVAQAGALWDFFERYPSFAALVARENVAGALGDPSPFVQQNAAAIALLRGLFEDAIASGAMAAVNISQTIFWISSYCTTFHGCRPLRAAVWSEPERARARDDFLASLRSALTPPETTP